MNEHPFMKGMGLGMLAGAAVGMTMMKNERTLKRKAKQAARSMSNMVENATDAIGQKLPH